MQAKSIVIIAALHAKSQIHYHIVFLDSLITYIIALQYVKA
jgi:hypothetical protein